MAKLYAKAPDGSDALLSIVITGFTQSLQQNGWCKLPNGLLIQWSNITLTDDMNKMTITIPFSITYTGDCLSSVISYNSRASFWETFYCTSQIYKYEVKATISAKYDDLFTTGVSAKLLVHSIGY